MLFQNNCMVEYERICLSEYMGHKETKFVFNQQRNDKLAQNIEGLVKLLY